MMLEPHSVPPGEYRRGFRRRARCAGTSVLTACAGISVLGAGTAAVALAGTHSAARHPLVAQCRNLCVSVQAAGTAAPGQTVSFGIHIAPVSLLDNVTVRISAESSQPPAFAAPAFTSCPSGDGTQTCVVGLLQAGQATELQARVFVPAAAPGGDTATLSATATCALLGLVGTGSASGSAAISVVRSQPTPTPTPTPPPSRHPSPPPTSPPTGGRHPGPPSSGGRHPSPNGPGGRPPIPAAGSQLGPGLGGLALGGVPPLGGGLGAVGAYQNPSSLFPLINPLPAASGAGPSRQARRAHRPYRTTAAADVLPLSLRQVGYQVAALGALVLGIALAVVRVPLRRRRAR